MSPNPAVNEKPASVLPAANSFSTGWKSPAALLIAAIACSMLLIAAPPALQAQAPADHREGLSRVAKLPDSAVRLTVNEETGMVAVGMTVHGAAFCQYRDGRLAGEPAIYPDWPTLYALFLNAEHVLLADRFSKLRLIRFEDPADPSSAKELATWEIEGIPTHLALRDETLLIAAGGAGLLLYEWKGIGSDPILRGRYPFTDYTKKIALGENGLVYIADNFDTGVQIIDVSNPMRPRRILQRSLGFVDSVSRHRDILAVTSRSDGTILFDISTPSVLKNHVFITPLRPRPGVPLIVARVEFGPGGKLLIPEQESGARLFSVTKGPAGIQTEQIDAVTFNQSLLDGLFLPDGKILLGLRDGSLILWSPKTGTP